MCACLVAGLGFIRRMSPSSVGLLMSLLYSVFIFLITTESYSLMVLKSRCQPGQAPSEGSSGDPSLSLPAPGDCQQPLVSSASRCITPAPLPLSCGQVGLSLLSSYELLLLFSLDSEGH